MDGHVGHAGGEAKFDSLVGKQAQGPAGVALGGVRLGEGEQLRFKLPVEDDLPGRAGLGFAAQGGFESFLDEAFLTAFDGPNRAADSLGNIGDGPAGPMGAAVAEQQHAILTAHLSDRRAGTIPQVY